MSFRKCVPGFLFLLGVGGVVAVFAPVIQGVRDNKHPNFCQSNLKQISLAVKQYVKDYNECFPLASTTSGGWVDGIYPYLKSTQVFQCPSETTRNLPPTTPNKIPFDPKLSGLTDYYYNAKLRNRSEGSIEYISNTVLLGDGNDGVENTDATYAKSSIPPQWRTDKFSPAYRHLEGANYAFADGHVKWFKVNQIKDKENAGKDYYFWPK